MRLGQVEVVILEHYLRLLVVVANDCSQLPLIVKELLQRGIEEQPCQLRIIRSGDDIATGGLGPDQGEQSSSTLGNDQLGDGFRRPFLAAIHQQRVPPGSRVVLVARASRNGRRRFGVSLL